MPDHAREAIILPELWSIFGADPEADARVRHPSFQAGLHLVEQGSKHMPNCPTASAGKYDHSSDCTCLKRPSRPGLCPHSLLF
jgi:hypothetical protein